MHTYVFVDTSTNTIYRVVASDHDRAWDKYIDFRIAMLPKGEKSFWANRPRKFIRTDLEHDVVVKAWDEIPEV